MYSAMEPAMPEYRTYVWYNAVWQCSAVPAGDAPFKRRGATTMEIVMYLAACCTITTTVLALYDRTQRRIEKRKKDDARKRE